MLQTTPVKYTLICMLCAHTGCTWLQSCVLIVGGKVIVVSWEQPNLINIVSWLNCCFLLCAGVPGTHTKEIVVVYLAKANANWYSWSNMKKRAQATLWGRNKGGGGLGC